MTLDRGRTLRGALAGAAAAGAWAAAQPLDKLAFGSAYDDVELLGKLVTRGQGWYPVGLAIHLQNGALFGAVYANVGPLLPVPGWSRAPLAAELENLALWPLGRLVDRFHPARRDMPRLTGNRRVLAQSTWRHLLFGVVLGVLEQRLNRPAELPRPPYEQYLSSNGHGDLERAVDPGAAASAPPAS